MIYYSLVLAISIFGIYAGSRVKTDFEKKVLCYLILIPAFFLIAFRNYNVGADTYSYYYIYNNMSNYDSVSIPLSKTWMEAGYVLLTYFTSHIGIDYFGFQVLVSLFYFIIVSRTFIKHSNNIGMSCFLFITMAIMFGMMNQTRMWISITISLCALDKIEEKKLLSFIAIIIIASIFHTSAIVFLLAYPLRVCVEKNYLKITRFLLVVCSVIMVIGKPFFAWITEKINRYGSYLDKTNDKFAVAAILNFGINAMIFIVIYVVEKNILSEKKMSVNKDDIKNIENTEFVRKQAVTAYMYSLVTLGLSIIELANSLVSRAIFFYSFPLVFAFTNSLEKIKGDKNRFIVKFFVIILFIAKMYIILIYRPKWDAVVPYEFFWDNKT